MELSKQVSDYIHHLFLIQCKLDTLPGVLFDIGINNGVTRKTMQFIKAGQLIDIHVYTYQNNIS